MRKMLWLGVPVFLGACNSSGAGFDVVSVRPMYGWDDGCNTVKVGGHGFGDDIAKIEGTIGSAALTVVAGPEREIDIGFLFYAQVPSNVAGDFYDVTVKDPNGGEDSKINLGYYYLECPRAPYPESVTAAPGVAAGSVVTVTGCNLDAAAVRVVVGTAAPVALTSTCGEGIATFLAPELADGEYPVSFVDSAGVVVWPVELCDDTAIDTACVPDAQYTLVYGGAE